MENSNDFPKVLLRKQMLKTVNHEQIVLFFFFFPAENNEATILKEQLKLRVNT